MPDQKSFLLNYKPCFVKQKLNDTDEDLKPFEESRIIHIHVNINS